MENTKDTHRNAYKLTINNPLDYGYSHNKIKKILLNKIQKSKIFQGKFIFLVEIRECCKSKKRENRLKIN